MASQDLDVTTPELDTREHESPASAQRSHPDLALTTVTWGLLTAVTFVANIIVLGIARESGAAMQADLGGMTLGITWATVLVATAAWLLFAGYGWALIAHRVPAFAHLWVPLHWGMGLVAFGAVVAVTGVRTAIAVGIMILLSTLAAAHAVPRRLPR